MGRGHGRAVQQRVALALDHRVDNGAGGGEERLEGLPVGLRDGQGGNPVAGVLERAQERAAGVIVDDGRAGAGSHGVSDLGGEIEGAAADEGDVVADRRREISGVAQAAVVKGARTPVV